MKPWVLVAVAVGGLCFMCSGGALLLALAGDDDGPSGGRASLGTASSCTGTIDGWQQSIAEGVVVLRKEQVTVELPWSFEFTDALRQGDSELNVWQAVLGARYEPGTLERGQYGEPRLAGPATERATGRTVFIVFTSGAMSGFTNPVVVIGPDEGTLRAFPTYGSLDALKDLNRFSLSCAGVEGRWKSGFHTAAERYAAGTGRYLGVEAVAAWREMTLENGSYRRESSALLNGVFNKRVDSGGWTHDDWSLVLEPEGDEAIAFDAAYVAVQSGFLLRLANRKYAADIEEFQRVE